MDAEANAAQAEGRPFAVFKANWRTVRVFVETWRQWQLAVRPRGVSRLGMDWTQVAAALRLTGIKRRKWPAIYRGLLVMQDEVLTALEENA